MLRRSPRLAKNIVTATVPNPAPTPVAASVPVPSPYPTTQEGWSAYILDRLPTDGYAYTELYCEMYGISVHDISHNLYEQVLKIDPKMTRQTFPVTCPKYTALCHYINTFNATSNYKRNLVDKLYATMLRHPLFLYMSPSLKDVALTKAQTMPPTLTLTAFCSLCEHLDACLAWYCKPPTLKPHRRERTTRYTYWSKKNDAYLPYDEDTVEDEAFDYDGMISLFPEEGIPKVIPPEPYTLDETTQRAIKHFVSNFDHLASCKVHTVYKQRQGREHKLIKVVLIHEGVMLEITEIYIMKSNYAETAYMLEHEGYMPVKISLHYSLWPRDDQCCRVTLHQNTKTHTLNTYGKCMKV
jgi:hypothetical protein